MFLGCFWSSPHAASFVPFCRLHALGRMCTLPSRRLCLLQGLHFLRKEFWLESRWVLKIKAEKGPAQRNSVAVALFSFMWFYGLNVFLCISSWSAVRQWGTNTMERSLLDSIRLVWWVFPLSPDSFYWELQKFAGGNPWGWLQAETWDQRALRHVSGQQRLSMVNSEKHPNQNPELPLCSLPNGSPGRVTFQSYELPSPVHCLLPFSDQFPSNPPKRGGSFMLQSWICWAFPMKELVSFQQSCSIIDSAEKLILLGCCGLDIGVMWLGWEASSVWHCHIPLLTGVTMGMHSSAVKDISLSPKLWQ